MRKNAIPLNETQEALVAALVAKPRTSIFDPDFVALKASLPEKPTKVLTQLITRRRMKLNGETYPSHAKKYAPKSRKPYTRRAAAPTAIDPQLAHRLSPDTMPDTMPSQSEAPVSFCPVCGSDLRECKAKARN